MAHKRGTSLMDVPLLFTQYKNFFVGIAQYLLSFFKKDIQLLKTEKNDLFAQI
jgi:hypothetical protein